MKKLFVLLAAALVLGAAVCGCRRESASSPGGGDAGGPLPAETAVPVRTAPVERLETSFPIHTAGTLALKETLKLSFKVGGLVERIEVDEGQAVSPGQLLARLDLAEIDARAATARAALDKAARDLERARLQLTRQPRPLPRMRLNPAVKDLFAFRFEDFTLEGYNPHLHIPGDIAGDRVREQSG